MGSGLFTSIAIHRGQGTQKLRTSRYRPNAMIGATLAARRARQIAREQGRGCQQNGAATNVSGSIALVSNSRFCMRPHRDRGADQTDGDPR